MSTESHKRLKYTMKLPQVEDLKKHKDKFPVEAILAPILAKQKSKISFSLSDWSAAKRSADLSALETWIDNINTLTHDAYVANSHALFFYSEGIPDEPYRISPVEMVNRKNIFQILKASIITIKTCSGFMPR